jgi:hypothetical protein
MNADMRRKPDEARGSPEMQIFREPRGYLPR